MNVFQDLPLLSRNVRLNVIELESSDKQITNELVYRWCRILTRNSGSTERKVLIIDMLASISLVRMATVLKRGDRRMRMIGILRGCKINSTFVTLNSYIGRHVQSTDLKLVVIYQAEFFILRTLTLLKDFLQATKCQVLLVVPKLDRREKDVLNLTANNQIIKCDFCVKRREIAPAPPETTSDSYQAYLNQIYFKCQRHPKDKAQEMIYGELREDGLYLNNTQKKHEYSSDISSRLSITSTTVGHIS